MTDYLQETKWSIPQVLLVLGGGLVGAALAGTFTLIVMGPEITVTAFSISFAGQAAGSLAVMWLMSRIAGTGNPRRDFGLVLHRSQIWVLFVGMGLQIAVTLVTAPLIQFLYPDGAPQQEVADLAEQAGGVLDSVLVFVSVGILAPVVEEMIFRGMLLSRLVREQRWEIWQLVLWLAPLPILVPLVLLDAAGGDAGVGGVPVVAAIVGFAVWTGVSGVSWWVGRRSVTAWAVIVQAVAFAGIHLLDPNAIAVIPGLFIIGLVLGFAAIRGGDLSLPIFIHAGVNLLAAFLLVFGGPVADWLEEIDQGVVQAVLRLLG